MQNVMYPRKITNPKWTEGISCAQCAEAGAVSEKSRFVMRPQSYVINDTTIDKLFKMLENKRELFRKSLKELPT